MNNLATILMGRRSFTAVIACATVAVSSLGASGQSISGTISFTGGADLDNALTMATQYTGFFGPGTGNVPVVLGGSQTGSFASVAASTPVTFSPFVFLPFSSPQTLWSFTSGGDTYSFVATSITDMDMPGYLNLSGNGFISITGLTTTPATWSYTDTGAGTGPGFNFGASVTATPTPEPSTISLVTLFGLLGFAFRGIARRKFAA